MAKGTTSKPDVAPCRWMLIVVEDVAILAENGGDACAVHWVVEAENDVCGIVACGDEFVALHEGVARPE